MHRAGDSLETTIGNTRDGWKMIKMMVLKKVPRNIFDIIRQRSKTGVAMCSNCQYVWVAGSSKWCKTMGCTSHKHKKKWAYALRTHYKHTQSRGRQKEKGWAPGHYTHQRTCLQAWTCRCLMFAGLQNCDTTNREERPNYLLFTFSTEKARHLQCLFVPNVLRNEQNTAFLNDGLGIIKMKMP